MYLVGGWDGTLSLPRNLFGVPVSLHATPSKLTLDAIVRYILITSCGAFQGYIFRKTSNVVALNASVYMYLLPSQRDSDGASYSSLL